MTTVAPECHAIKAEEPWTVVTIDLLGPFDATHRNYVYVILLTDVFTKWVVVLPLRDLSAAEVTRAIVNTSFSYGLPQKIAIDQGEEFVHQVRQGVKLCYRKVCLIILDWWEGKSHKYIIKHNSKCLF